MVRWDAAAANAAADDDFGYFELIPRTPTIRDKAQPLLACINATNLNCHYLFNNELMTAIKDYFSFLLRQKLKLNAFFSQSLGPS